MKMFKLAEYKPKILLFQGSPRNKNSCPQMMSKSHTIVNYITDNFKNVDWDVCDLSIERDKPNIQPCKGCMSSAGGFQCHWPCSCYGKGSKTPDFMYEENIYSRLEECDAFMVVTPIHWYSFTSVVKLLFDRLVCANLTLTQEQAKEIGMLDEKGWKQLDNYNKIPRNKIEEIQSIMSNHLAGKYAAFFVHGDDGANEYISQPKPESFMQDKECYGIIRTVEPLICQCRYSGIFVENDCVGGAIFNKNKNYYDANKSPIPDAVLEVVNNIVNNLIKKLM